MSRPVRLIGGRVPGLELSDRSLRFHNCGRRVPKRIAMDGESIAQGRVQVLAGCLFCALACPLSPFHCGGQQTQPSLVGTRPASGSMLAASVAASASSSSRRRRRRSPRPRSDSVVCADVLGVPALRCLQFRPDRRRAGRRGCGLRRRDPRRRRRERRDRAAARSRHWRAGRVGLGPPAALLVHRSSMPAGSSIPLTDGSADHRE